MTTPDATATTPDTPPRWSILYRGPLSSCNYACDYCPFAKTRNTRAELADDAARLRRFTDWAATRADRRIGILFTPWGEALVRKHYQSEIARLSHMPHVYRVAAQTNLSCRLDWLEACHKPSVALWTTYHPTQTARERFLERCAELDARGVRYSVGMVGFKEAFEEIEAVRAALPPSVYLWVNAYKRQADYYQPEDIARVEAVDPLFRWNTRYHPSAGYACQGGESMFSVDGDGEAYRCHFIKARIGNIYDEGFDEALRPRPCSNDTCGCHIGYVHMDRLGLYDVFGDGVLERVPQAWGSPGALG